MTPSVARSSDGLYDDQQLNPRMDLASVEMKSSKSARQRTQLWCAWTFPVFLAVSARHSVSETIMAAIISVAPGGIVASLPPKGVRIACALSVLALPFTIWWCGYAAIDHAGPGIDRGPRRRRARLPGSEGRRGRRSP